MAQTFVRVAAEVGLGLVGGAVGAVGGFFAVGGVCEFFGLEDPIETRLPCLGPALVRLQPVLGLSSRGAMLGLGGSF